MRYIRPLTILSLLLCGISPHRQLHAQVQATFSDADTSSAVSLLKITTMTPSVNSSPINGVTLVPYLASGSTDTLSKTLSPSKLPTLQPLLPYSVIVKNNGSIPVLGFTVIWEAVQSDGHPYTDFRGVIDYVTLKSVVPPGQSLLVTAIGTPDDLPAGSQLVSMVQQQVQEFQSRVSLAISLDAVVLSDGTSLGADKINTISEMRARIKSEYDLFTSVLAKAATGTSGNDITTWLQVLASTATPNVDLRGDYFSARYRQYTARIAASLAKAANGMGPSEMIKSVQAILDSKHYPKEIVQ